jgi:hypothetical protein
VILASNANTWPFGGWNTARSLHRDIDPLHVFSSTWLTAALHPLLMATETLLNRTLLVHVNDQGHRLQVHRQATVMSCKQCVHMGKKVPNGS